MIALVNRPDELVSRGGVDVIAHVAAQVAGQPVLAIVGRGENSQACHADPSFDSHEEVRAGRVARGFAVAH